MSEFVKFAFQVEEEVLTALQKLAIKEGRELHDIINMALKNYLEVESEEKQRADVVAAFKNSVRKYDESYRRLAQ